VRMRVSPIRNPPPVNPGQRYRCIDNFDLRDALNAPMDTRLPLSCERHPGIEHAGARVLFNACALVGSSATTHRPCQTCGGRISRQAFWPIITAMRISAPASTPVRAFIKAGVIPARMAPTAGIPSAS